LDEAKKTAVLVANERFNGDEPSTLPGGMPVPQLEFTPPGGVYTQPQSISIQSSNFSGPLHYTLDGSNPKRSSPVYLRPGQLDKSVILTVACLAPNRQLYKVSYIDYLIHPEAVRVELDDASWRVSDADGGGSVHDGPSQWSVSNDMVTQSSNIYQGSSSATASDPRDGTLRFFQGFPVPTDGEIYLELKCDDDDSVGIAFRARDETHHYLFAMDAQRKFHALTLRNGSDHRVLATSEGWARKVKDKLGVWRQVRISLRGDLMTVYVNGRKDLQATDKTFSDGTFALYCWGLEGAHFRNIFFVPPNGTF